MTVVVPGEMISDIRLSDPLPARCSACLRSAGEGVRFVDFQAAFDGGAVVEEGMMAVRDSIDELHLCEACVKKAASILDYKPDLHAKQYQEIRRLELERDHWRDTAVRIKREADAQFEANLGQPKPRRRAA